MTETILSPKSSSGKAIQCKSGTQLHRLCCHPPTIEVPLGSRWLLEHLPSPLKARHQEGASREGQMGCLSFQEPSKIFCPQTSACLVARNVHTLTPSCKGAWQMG